MKSLGHNGFKLFASIDNEVNRLLLITYSIRRIIFSNISNLGLSFPITLYNACLIDLISRS